MDNLKCFLFMAAAVCLSACSSSPSGSEPEPEPEPSVSQRIPINLNVGCGLYEQEKTGTRIADTYFEPEDAIGLYVASGIGMGASSNYVNNVRCVYTSSAAWKPDTELYWKDETTPSDFYAYYPYTAQLADATALAFQVKADQSSLVDYKRSDLVWGRTMGVQPTEEAVMIQTRHLMANLVVEVRPGNGFTQEKLDAAEVKVKVEGLQTAARVNLSDGSLAAEGEARVLSACYIDQKYKLLVVPQTTVGAVTVVVVIDGSEFKLQKTLSLQGGHRYTLPMTVNKTSNGINVSIDDWIDDGIDNGGVAE